MAVTNVLVTTTRPGFSLPHAFLNLPVAERERIWKHLHDTNIEVDQIVSFDVRRITEAYRVGPDTYECTVVVPLPEMTHGKKCLLIYTFQGHMKENCGYGEFKFVS